MQVVSGFPLLGYKKIHDFPGSSRTRDTFPGPYYKPAMFKYSDRQQLWGLRSTVSSSERQSQPRKHFWHTCRPEKVPGGNWLFSSAEKLPSASLPSKFQDFPWPRSFSRTFQVLEIFQKKSRIYRRRGNPESEMSIVEASIDSVREITLTNRHIITAADNYYRKCILLEHQIFEIWVESRN